ncbi:MAG: hypothetical protein ACKO23_05590 [Gemmataceae bacterium]
MPYQELRSLARQELIISSEQVGTWNPTTPLIAAGHQPELFHPGVWVKNFFLAGLSRRTGSSAVNLLIDNDTVKTTGVALPIPGKPWPHIQVVNFDIPTGEIPWEERKIIDPTIFASFGKVAEDALSGWSFSPLLGPFWPEVVRQSERYQGNLGRSFAGARSALERKWGCNHEEVPLSKLCDGEAFAWLFATILADLPRVCGIYNEVVQDYRSKHRLRSRNHPVPNLHREDDWLETPFWGWTDKQPHRGQLFARVSDSRVDLKSGTVSWPTLPSPLTSPSRFVKELVSLRREGFKVRSRALFTTLFARLFLSDLFIHGIGGAKYDELTDEMIRRFWGLPVPSFLTLSATCLLPLPNYPVTEEQVRSVQHQLRDMEFNPQRHLPPEQRPALACQLEEKASLVSSQPQDRQGRRARFRNIRSASASLRQSLIPTERKLRDQLNWMTQAVDANRLLRRRDYAFPLYPEDKLRPFCQRFLS